MDRCSAEADSLQCHRPVDRCRSGRGAAWSYSLPPSMSMRGAPASGAVRGGSLPLNHHSRVCGPERVGAGPSDESARGEGAETERYADHLTTLKRALIEYRQPIRGVYRPNRLPQFMPEGHSSPLTSAESTQAPLGASFRSDMLCRIPSVAPSPDSVEISGLPAVDVAPRKPH